MTLTAKQRKKLPATAFAYPKSRTYPIDTVERAKSALSRAGQKKTRGSYTHVAKAVRVKHGEKIASVGKAKGTVTHAGYRKSPRRSTRRG